MTKPQQTEALIRLLLALKSAMQDLLDVLEQESAVLRNKDFSQMERLAADKEQHVTRIEQLEQERKQFCQQYQISPDKTGLATFLHAVPARVAEKVQDLWQSIAELGNTCMEHNRINGIVVAHQQRHTQDALAILRGALTSNELYSAKGARSAHGGQHSLGRV